MGLTKPKESRNGRTQSRRGSAILVITYLMAIMMGVAVYFLNKSMNSVSLTSLEKDRVSSAYTMESGYEFARGRLSRAIANIALRGDMPLLQNGPSDENILTLWSVYGTDDTAAMNFLRHAIESQAIKVDNTFDTTHEFYDFDVAFPSDWTDPDLNDDDQYEIKYEFSAVQPTEEDVGTPSGHMMLEYEVVINVRAYGGAQYTKSSSEDTMLFRLKLEAIPFSRFALYRSTNRNQLHSNMHIVGGNTVNEIQEVFNGPVHLNEAPYFQGHPVFNSAFTSGASEADWTQTSSANYDCCAIFNGPKIDNGAIIDTPDVLGQTSRLAAGGTGASEDPVTETEKTTLLANYVGVLDTNSPNNEFTEGIYIPVDNTTDLNPTGGIFVEGDGKIILDVVQGSAEIGTDYYNNIQAAHNTCKFQKISVTKNGAAGNGNQADDPDVKRDVLVGDDPCNVTYVFDPDNPTAAPTVLNARINGNVHVEGELTELGSASRTSPAIATDFGFSVSAEKTITITNDLQYEDVEYVSLDATGAPTTTVVANPEGEVGGSGYAPTDQNISPTIDDDSKTILGIISYYGNVSIRQDAPPNLNVHGVVYAGYSQGLDLQTGHGCGPASDPNGGCGFGYEGWFDELDMGSIKVIGAVSEYKTQLLGRPQANPPTGYQRQLAYDTRLYDLLTPPGFPLSSGIIVYYTIEDFKAWRLAASE